MEGSIDQRGQWARHTGLVVETWATHTVDSTVVVESEEQQEKPVWLLWEEKPVWLL